MVEVLHNILHTTKTCITTTETHIISTVLNYFIIAVPTFSIAWSVLLFVIIRCGGGSAGRGATLPLHRVRDVTAVQIPDEPNKTLSPGPATGLLSQCQYLHIV